MTNELVFDIGMHDGSDTTYYLASGFRVLAVEADPSLVAQVGRRFPEEIQSGKLIILNVAMAAEEGESEFWINEIQSTLNSFNRETTARRGHTVHAIKVRCTRLDTLISQYGVPHFIKIDIEGHDLICCDQLSVETRPHYISVEMTCVELLQRLQKIGYNRFQLIDQRHLKPTRDRNPLLLQVYRLANYRKKDRSFILRSVRKSAALLLNVAEWMGVWGTVTARSQRLSRWRFHDDSSGGFGDDLPDRWQTFGEVSAEWSRFEKECEDLNQEPWCDLHATF